jgi:heme exporter protein CcmD
MIPSSYDIWVFVLLSYGVAVLVLGTLCITAYLRYRKTRAQLQALETSPDA